MSRVKRFRSGFTLVELLVVIAIIAVLISILLPVVNQVRKQALRIKCAANLHSLGQALIMYTQQYNYYPACYVPGEAIATGIQNSYAIWPTRLRLFTRSQDVFYCPASNPECQWREKGYGPGVRTTEALVGFGYKIGERVLWRGGSWSSYGYNAQGPGYDNGWSPGPSGGYLQGLGIYVNYAKKKLDFSPEPKASWVKVPSEMVAMGDTISVGFDDFSLKCTIDFWDSRFGRPRVHSGGINVLFCDGHVQWYRKEDIFWSTQNRSDNKFA